MSAALAWRAMIEYTDKVFGKIKVLNVTEARANFANVLGDSDSHYIITKNNKPLRVIINHAEYETLRRVGEAAGNQGLTTHEGSPVDHLVEAFTREAAKDAVLMEKAQESSRAAPAVKTFENPVKGILETNIALSKTEKTKPKKPLPKPLSESPLLANTQADSKEESELASRQTLLASQGAFERDDEDYFYSASGDVSDTTDVLIEPDDFIESESSQEHGARSVSTEPPKAQAAPVISPSQHMTPEESEYFQKYKKLYESAGIATGNEQDDKEFEKRLQQKYAALYAESNKGQDVAPEPVVLNQNEVAGNMQRQEIQNFEPSPRDRAQIDEEEDGPQNYFTDTAEDEAAGLPSLKELLKDLEEEKLSGEDVNVEDGLDERDIDDLIERITQD